MASRFEQPGEFERPGGEFRDQPQPPLERPRPPMPPPHPRGGFSKKLKYIAGFAVLVIAAALVLWGDRIGESRPEIDPTPWRGDVDAATVESKFTHKPTLFYFTANWCVPCKEMRRSVFPDERVQALLKGNFVLVKIDLTRPDTTMEAFQEKWKVRDLPTFVALAPDGSELDRAAGGMHLDGMVSWLEAVVAMAKRDSVPAR